MKLIKLSAIDSTNDYAKKLLQRGSPTEVTIVWAIRQTAGRGQQGNSWHATGGKSLTFSLVKELSTVPVSASMNLNFAVSLGIYNVLLAYELPELRIKWPNDILSDGRKLGGILIENQLRGSKVARTVVGVGLNVNNLEFPGLPGAVSMKMRTGVEYELEELLWKLARAIDHELELPGSAEGLRERYEAVLFRKGEISSFITRDGSRFEGVISGVDQQGALCVRKLSSNKTSTYGLNELSLLY